MCACVGRKWRCNYFVVFCRLSLDNNKLAQALICRSLRSARLARNSAQFHPPTAGKRLAAEKALEEAFS